MKRPAAWIVEDSALEGRAACDALGPLFDCTVFTSCPPALERLNSGDTPDVLLLDWGLPDMTGIEACRFIRTTHDEVQLPVLMVTVRRDREDVLEGLRAGANDFVVKPFAPAELHARVKTLARIRQLNQENRQAAQESRARAEFERQLIGIVSHDLRNPLSTLSMGTYLLLAQEDLDQQNRKTLARMQSAAQRGTRMIGDLLDFTQARLGGGIPLTLSAGNVHEIVKQVLEDVEINATDRHIRISAAGDGEGTWDLERISQVVLNLLSNALKYSPIDSDIELRSEGDSEGVTVTVHNVGEPIPPDSLTRIFEPMQRATTELNNAARSIGLGLYIVKHLVEAHAGRVSVLSTREVGTTFSFWLPKRSPASIS
jgi:signal transduction histidine kinase